MTIEFFAAALLGAGPARAAETSAAPRAPSPKQAAGALAKSSKAQGAVEASTGTAEGPSVESIYGGEKYRDPFLAQLGAGAQKTEAPAAAPEEFSIHSLALRGIMQDPSGYYALLTETGSGNAYILKKGRLFDFKGKLVRGVAGVVRPKQKMVTLQTPDKDTQPLFLGETEESEDEKP